MNFSYQSEKNEKIAFYLNSLTIDNWKEKRRYDYYHQVIKHVPLSRLNILNKVPGLSTLQKAEIVARFLRDKWLKKIG